jgi:hypothetical protein
MKPATHHILDHITDVAGIASITTLAYYGAMSPEAAGAVLTIATGGRYLKGKANAYTAKE